MRDVAASNRLRKQHPGCRLRASARDDVSRQVMGRAAQGAVYHHLPWTGSAAPSARVAGMVAWGPSEVRGGSPMFALLVAVTLAVSPSPKGLTLTGVVQD